MTYHSLPNPGNDDPGARIPRRYAWVVFALSFGLLLSDYMSRQVLNAVFPLLKAGVGAVGCPARAAERHRGADGGAADVPAVAARRPVRTGQEPGADGDRLEPGDARLRPGAGLSADAGGAFPGRRRRGGLWQCRHCRRAVGVPQAHAGDADGRVHGRWHVRFGAGHGVGRSGGRAYGLALGLRRGGLVRPGTGVAVPDHRPRKAHCAVAATR